MHAEVRAGSVKKSYTDVKLFDIARYSAYGIVRDTAIASSGFAQEAAQDAARLRSEKLIPALLPHSEDFCVDLQDCVPAGQSSRRTGHEKQNDTENKRH
jgi:hypothetical protein